MISKEDKEIAVSEIVRLAKEDVSSFLNLLDCLKDIRLRKIFVHAFSNGTTARTLESELLTHFETHGPSPIVLLNRLYQEKAYEPMPAPTVCDGATRTKPNGICLGSLCGQDGHITLPVKEICPIEELCKGMG